MKRFSWTTAVALALVMTSGCTGKASSPEPSDASEARAASSSRPPAPRVVTARAGQPIAKVLVVITENHSLSQMRSRMPYVDGLARKFGYATHYTAVAHPSLPNYIAMTSGSTHGIRDDGPPASHPVAATSVFAQALAHGRTAGLYADGMPGNCRTADGGDDYAVKHNPWAYFPSESKSCRANDRPLSVFRGDVQDGRLPNVGLLIPNLCHDAHNCSLAVADSWIKTVLRTVFAGPDWASGRLAIVVTADEDDHKQGNRVLTVVADPSLHGRVVTAPLSHYSLSALLSAVAHALPLARAASAPSMSKAFNLRVD